MHSILIIGQSNMAGRGFPGEVAPIDTTDLFVLRNGRWWKMYTPVNPDRVTVGVNLVESFAARYRDDHGVEVGVIPCADGGTSLDQWAVGGVLFDHAVYMTEPAQRTSTVTAILWHQGESDCYPDGYPLYEEKFTRILTALREKTGLHDVPVLVGGLGDYLVNYHPEMGVFGNYVYVNEALQNVAKKQPNVGFVSAEGLGANPDNLHFSAKALREFGLRYYEEFLKLEDREAVAVEKSTDAAMAKSEMEKL
ncbi:MAG: sialate O-acetylesterase [Ruminococcaceae bacterium]|nr:sialate O-acetylesterase [Oscillospiraceae bacterium]